jgi:HTH-type transcriptional regulator, glycine betaine synthesis regulator
MDAARGIFVDGIGAAAATSGVLSLLQGRIFALLYLQPKPLALEDIASELQQSKSNVSINIRGLIEWHLVRRISVPGSRKDHYEAATNFWRVMQEVMERRFRWTVRQVLAAIGESERALGEEKGRSAAQREAAVFVTGRLAGLRFFFTAVDAAISAFTQGKPVTAETLQNVIPFPASTPRQRG